MSRSYASALASVWFTAYPPSQITGPGESVLESLGDADLWRIFRDIGIGGMHTGPMKRAGGLRGREYTETVDGNFDRISSEIDPAFGTQAQFTAMVRRAADNRAVVIGDIIPGHSGKGADFRLAERRYGDYPGLYHMVEIGPEDWGLLPAVPAGRDSVNLKPATVDALRARYRAFRARFPGRKVFPIQFLLRHYPIRSQRHGETKVFTERKPRFLESVSRGHMTQSALQ